MPPRLDLLTKRRSTFDLPILPCLAPRVFQPWPSGRRPVHSESQAVQKEQDVVGRDYNNPLQTSDLEKRKSRHAPSNLSPTRSNHERPKSQNTRDKGEGIEVSEEPLEVSGDDQISSFELSGLPSKEEDFLQKYDEIWGMRTKKITEPPLRRVVTERAAKGATVFRNIALEWTAPKSITFYRSKTSAKNRILSPSKQNAYRSIKFRRIRAQYQQRRILRAWAGQIPEPEYVLRPRTWRLTPGRGFYFPNFVSSWWSRFIELNLRYQNFARGREIPKLPPLPSLVSKTYQRELIEHDSVASLRVTWSSIPEPRRRLIWGELMITTLKDHPDRAMMVLEATLIEPLPPSYAVSDCLDFLISHHLHRSLSPKKASFVNNVLRLVRDAPSNYIHLSQHSMYVLLTWMEPRFGGYVKKLYETMTEMKHPLHQNTLMHFASTLAKRGETDVAFGILQRLSALGCDFNTPKMLSLCSTLLLRVYRDPNATFSETEIFEFVLRCGMIPNVITYNVLLHNALQAGDSGTGWQIHDMMMEESGIEPVAHTYSLLLNDAKLRMDHLDIRRVMGIVQEKGIKNPFIITDVLHAIYLLHRQEKEKTYDEPSPQGERRTAFDRMLQVYREYFQIWPLARIIPSFHENYPGQSSSEDISSVETDLWYPPAPTIRVMILGFLSECNNSGVAKQFYDHFQDLVVSRDPAVESLTAKTHVWNMILLTFAKFPDRLPDCPNLVGDMLALSKTSPKEPESRGEDRKSESDKEGTSINDTELAPLSDPQESSPRVPDWTPKPDVYTWSILLKIFMDHNQPRAAEKVIELMTSNNVKPNIVTWSILAAGYARLQDPTMTVDAVDRLEKAGFNANDLTMRGLYGVRDRRVLIEAMKRKDARKITATQAWMDTLKSNLREGMEDDGDNIPRSMDEAKEKEITVNEFRAEVEDEGDDFIKVEFEGEDP
jgi:pentatricopeptide repeat protein